MFGKSISLFRIFGVPIKLHTSWFFLAVLVLWSLAKGYFPQFAASSAVVLPEAALWWMGLVGTIGLFFSILFHEMFHAVVAQRFGMPVGGITLFVFGGISELGDESPSPKAEFWMAIAGPASSVGLSALFFALYWAAVSVPWPLEVQGLCFYLGWVNSLLAIFNLVPAFPLDGGRVLRSILWRWKGNIDWATRITAKGGALFGVVLIALGLIRIVFGNFVGGLWFFLLGLFLREMAASAYQQMILSRHLLGQTVSRFMNPQPVTVSPDLTLKDFLENTVYRYHHKVYPVVQDGRLLGRVCLKALKAIPSSEWDQRRVKDILEPRDFQNTVRPTLGAKQALKLMRESENGRLLVAEGDRLVGVFSLKDMLRFLAFAVEMEEATQKAA